MAAFLFRLVRLGPDVIVTVAGGAALAAKRATTTIPIVMATVGERPHEIGFRGMACRGTQGTDIAKLELNISAAPSSYKDRSGVMSGSNEAIAHLQEKLEQARRLLQQVSDPTTTESLKALIADLESRLSDLLEPE